MRSVLSIGIFMCIATALAGDAVEALVAKNPVSEARKAFAAGDRRHIVVPVCGKDGGEVLPGWPLRESGKAQDAVLRGQRPVSCTDLGDDPKRNRFQRVANYAERYNGQLLKLESGKK